MFADKVLGPVKQWGYLVKDLVEAMASWVEQLGIGPWWGYRNVSVQALTNGQTDEVTMSVGLAYDQGFLDEYERCAAEASNWDGSDPYRLITF